MKTKDIKTKLKEYFLLNPTIKLRVRQIERELKVPFPSVIRYTKELEHEGILKTIKITNITAYSADRTSNTYLLEKKSFNIYQLHTSGLLEFIQKELSNPVIVLFGSYMRGEDTENSDIDLYIETPAKKKINLDKFEKILQRRIQQFIYKNIHELENKELANNILNGTVLTGFMEVFT